MSGRSVVVTGGNSGIGRATAQALASKGFTTVLACRNMETGEQAKSEIRTVTDNTAVHAVHLDLADLGSVAACASEIQEAVPAVDVLVNNAGGVWHRRELSQQGIEKTFAVDYLGHYALTRLLHPGLRRPGARVVNVTSAGHKMSRGINWADVGFDRGWHSMRAYAQAKLAQVLFTCELAKRDGEIMAHSVHPGFVNSNFYGADSPSGKAFEHLVHLSARFGIAKSPEQGAATTVHVATASEAAMSSGTYWVKARHHQPSRAARDADAAARLWDLSESMVAGADIPLPIWGG
jgi:NAD(P)-dependent dehydrogenase (short-subunit alcohol dehydrogenase family)